MQNLVLGMINKSIGNKNYHLHSIDEVIKILQKNKLSIKEKYYLKELFTIPVPILKEKFFKYLDEEKKALFLKKAQELGFDSENFKKSITLL